MKDYLRLVLPENLFHLLSVANVRTDVCLDLLANATEHKVVSLRIGIQTYSYHLCTKLVEPDTEPRSLETGMASYKNSFTSVEIIKYVYAHIIWHTKYRNLLCT